MKMDEEEARKHREEEQKPFSLAVDLATEQVIREIKSNGSISHIIPSQSLMDLSSSPSAQTQPYSDIYSHIYIYLYISLYIYIVRYIVSPL